MLANFPNQLFSCILAPSMSSKPFSGIIGHEAAISCLGRMLEDGTLAHAYLFVGQPRVGKRAVALALLNALFSVPGHIGSHPDIVMIRRETDEKTGKEKTAVSVEQVRDACERLSMTSLSGGRKALFIEEADRLNAAAGNALLKTLEEPRGDAIIILRANSVDAVPATIASRCQIVRFHPVPPATIAEAFVKRGVDREEAASLAQASFGAPGAALSLLTDGEYRAQEETAAAAAAQLFSPPVARRLRAASDLLPKDEANKGAVALRTLETWERILRERMLSSLSRKDARTLRRLRAARMAILHNASPQLALE